MNIPHDISNTITILRITPNFVCRKTVLPEFHSPTEMSPVMYPVPRVVFLLGFLKMETGAFPQRLNLMTTALDG